MSRRPIHRNYSRNSGTILPHSNWKGAEHEDENRCIIGTRAVGLHAGRSGTARQKGRRQERNAGAVPGTSVPVEVVPAPALAITPLISASSLVLVFCVLMSDLLRRVGNHDRAAPGGAASGRTVTSASPNTSRQFRSNSSDFLEIPWPSVPPLRPRISGDLRRIALSFAAKSCSVSW
jgi:hypothetical protein